MPTTFLVFRHTDSDYHHADIAALAGQLQNSGFIQLEHSQKSNATFYLADRVMEPITLTFKGAIITLPSNLSAEQLIKLPIWNVIRKKRTPFKRIKKEWLEIPAVTPADDHISDS